MFKKCILSFWVGVVFSSSVFAGVLTDIEEVLKLPPRYVSP